MLSYLIILVMPQNSIEKSNESALLSCISSTNIVVSLTINIVISSTIIIDIWQGIVFWLIAGEINKLITMLTLYNIWFAGTLLFWRCECCTCDGLVSNKSSAKVHCAHVQEDVIYEYKETHPDTIYVTRWHHDYLDDDILLSESEEDI